MKKVKNFLKILKENKQKIRRRKSSIKIKRVGSLKQDGPTFQIEMMLFVIVYWV